MAYHGIPIGTKVCDLDPRPRWLDRRLSDYGLSVGDLVACSSQSWWNEMTIYRIVSDSPPIGDAVWNEVKPRGSRYPYRGWFLPGSKKRITDKVLRGCIEIEPVFTFFHRYKQSQRKKRIAYTNLYRTQKLELMDMAKNFSDFQEFIMREAKRKST